MTCHLARGIQRLHHALIVWEWSPGGATLTLVAPQRVELWGGWSLELPSPCRTIRNQDGSWSAWDETHVVDVSIVEVGGRVGGGPIGPEQMLTGTESWDPARARRH